MGYSGSLEPSSIALFALFSGTMDSINDPIYSNTQRKTMHSFPSSVRDVLFVEMHYITRVLVHDTSLQVISNRLLISLHPHGFIFSSITSQLFKSPSSLSSTRCPPTPGLALSAAARKPRTMASWTPTSLLTAPAAQKARINAKSAVTAAASVAASA
jgi:hypothetical protein